MMTENLKALIAYRMEQAGESLVAAGLLRDNNMYRSSVNRSYYAMFYAVLALLARDKRETSKHSGAISLFDQQYVKTGLFETELSRRLHDAFDLRQRSDYAAEVLVSEEDAILTLENARYFVEAVEAFMKREDS